MTFEIQGKKDIPSLDASDDEWKEYWDSCGISGVSWDDEINKDITCEKLEIALQLQ